MIKELFLMSAAAGFTYYVMKTSPQPIAKPVPQKPKFVTRELRGKGPWVVKDGGCYKDKCDLSIENGHVSPTRYIDITVRKDVYDQLPDRFETAEQIKNLPGVLDFRME